MSKFRVTIDLDFAEIAPEATVSGSIDVQLVESLFKSMILNHARSQAISDLHAIRKNGSLDQITKARQMSEKLLHIKATLMAEANLHAMPLDHGSSISTQLPFEEQYSNAA